MDISKLTQHHIVFLPHPEVDNYYCLDYPMDNDVEYYFRTYMPMHNNGQVFLPAFALPIDKSINPNDFIEYLQVEFATSHIKIGDNTADYLYRDFYEFKTFQDHELWVKKYQQHKEAKRRFWLLQHKEEKIQDSVQKSLFD
ncbi:MAG TPA: hypothetical protein PLZ45_05410 [Ferruginibacter sp.]|nr:hypothetical protein [Chitinophagaceae bacterium]HRI24089.1 hypothetical protein [Ferruginibacter sp.]